MSIGLDAAPRRIRATPKLRACGVPWTCSIGREDLRGAGSADVARRARFRRDTRRGISTGPGGANRTRALLKKIWNLSISRVRGRAPCAGNRPLTMSSMRFVFTGTLLVVLAAAASAPSSSAADEPASLPKWKAGEQQGTVKIDGQDETFVALVPPGYSPKKPCPAVLLLHGNGGKASDFLQTLKPFAGKSPPLLISLERCDNTQKAEGYGPKYLEALRKQFALEDGKLFVLGFSGGGFRLWDDVVCKAEEAAKFRGIVLVGSARQSFDPADKPAAAPTVVLVGDPADTNFAQSGPAAEKALAAKGYEVIVLEHKAGHSTPAPEMKDVFAWISAVIDGKKTTLATRRIGDAKKK
jgi:predicted esterase